ncbi:relaxase/mobilization nuclease domain-containing protein [Bombella apis]|uniref:Relaxase/mobilization nuclease domain-containing protein n=1 Tax=Bombella apis TaxID=1785988 RepID=A0ABR9MMY0_9PROT|nr:LPD7 domain-containing protein [Bombella apis]MBE1723220.1 relaxase/mobilization nuclease domain-containing protein [Bombella apis]MBR9731027.1 relaxase/mobilization nuclease domain-containing protein [Bombella apis]
MIINSDALKAAPGPEGLIHHLLGKPEDNETIRLVSGSRDSIRFAYDDARSHGSKRGVLHIKLSPDTTQTLTAKDWQTCLTRLAQEYHFEGREISIIEHRKKGRVHRHVVVPFVDPVTGRKLDMGFSKLRDEKCARLLEMQLGHKLTPMKLGHRKAVCAYLKKSGQRQAAESVAVLPDSGIGTSLMAHQKAKRLGRDLADEKQHIKTLFQQVDGPAAFRAALKTEGLELRKGDKPDRYIICHSRGGLIGSANRLTGWRVKDFQHYMETDHETIRQKATQISEQGQKHEQNSPARPQDTGQDTSPGTRLKDTTPQREERADNRGETDRLLPEDTLPKQPGCQRFRRIARPVQSGPGRKAGRSYPASARDAGPAGGAGAEQRREADAAGRGSLAEQVRRLRQPVTKKALLIARTRLRRGLDPAYFADLLPRNEIRDPVSGNTLYRARLMRRYYGLSTEDPVEPHERLIERARQMAWVGIGADHFRIRLKNGEQFRDYGDRMTCPPGPIQPATAREIVLSAIAKGWAGIEVTGSQDFKDEIAIHARLNGIPCDHELSDRAQRKFVAIVKERGVPLRMEQEMGSPGL